MKENQEEWLELCKQASVEQDPEKLMRLVGRINELLDAKDQRLRGTAKSAIRGATVFQIAYDETLLIARAELLRNRGYEVSSVLGNEGARCTLDRNQQYRLFIVGHTAPSEAREEMVRWLKLNFPETRILALNPPSHPNLAEADYNFVFNGPEHWLSVVENVAG